MIGFSLCVGSIRANFRNKMDSIENFGKGLEKKISE